MYRLINIIFAISFVFAVFALPSADALSLDSQIEKYAGEGSAVLLTDESGRDIIRINADKRLVPASILKIFTSLAALHFLGPDYRFKTEFYVDDESLYIKGYGDPLLVSEVIPEITGNLARIFHEKNIALNNIFIDSSFFEDHIKIPGVTEHSSQPYDAPNGALCLNFNTVSYKKTGNQYKSAEEQTPLLPFILDEIGRYGRGSGRITFSREKGSLYAGHMIGHFLQKSGLEFHGTIKAGVPVNADCRLVYTYVSKYRLADIIEKLLCFSNNYIANQIFIAVGAEEFGSPGNLEKGVRALKKFAESEPVLNNIEICEGSGISRENRVSARQMDTVLKHFARYRRLMRSEEGEQNIRYKTGTLTGVASKAGYIVTKDGRVCRFTVILNDRHNQKNLRMDIRKIMGILKKAANAAI